MPNVTFEHYYPCLYFKIFFKKETRKRKTEGKGSLSEKLIELYLLLGFLGKKLVRKLATNLYYWL